MKPQGAIKLSQRQGAFIKGGCKNGLIWIFEVSIDFFEADQNCYAISDFF